MNARDARCTPLPVVVLPAKDECLGSWIGRVAAVYAVSTPSLLAHFGIQSRGTSYRNWLTLGGLNAAEMMNLARALRRATDTLKAMATSPWNLIGTAEFGMCAHCMLETSIAGHPIYWRSDWLNATTVGCPKHSTWLTGVAGTVFIQSANWLGVDRIILELAKRTVARASNQHLPDLTGPVNMSALNLQAIFSGRASDRVAQVRYGATSSGEARLVAQDLLDAMLATDSSDWGGSGLTAFSSLLGVPIASASLSITPRVTRSNCIRHVKRLEARIFAMAVVDNLMSASARIDSPDAQQERNDANSLRTHWLWTLMPSSSLALLTERAANWPTNYVTVCWPELENIGQVPMLHRKKRLITLRANREKTRANIHRLANIRAN
ncbi:MAG: TniQ family protein [Herminiimonas sp.]|nr:TniQ family protein [Herminiimonas sp.]